MPFTEQIPFALSRVRAGEIDIPQLSVGYLAVLAAATGRPLITAAAVSRVDRDWSDYDNPREEEIQEWGDETYGLRAFVSGQFVHHGRRGGGMTFWVFLGLPAGLKVRGEAKIHDRWQSYARLLIEEDQGMAARLVRAFREALLPDDVRCTEDGAAVAALEEALTLLCWYKKALDAALAPALKSAAKAVPIERPAGAAVRYLLACVAQATGDLDEAARLLGALLARGEALQFSHGIHCSRDTAGAPGQVAWQDDFPPPLPWADVLVSLGWVRERQGQQKDAIAHYRAAAAADKGLSGDGARQQLKRLGALVGTDFKK